MSDDPEVARWQEAWLDERAVAAERRLHEIVEEYLALKREMMNVIDLAAHTATEEAHSLVRLKQFADEGSKTAQYIVSVWGVGETELMDRSRRLSALRLKFETWRNR